MSGLVTIYQTPVVGENKFFKSMILFTSRYERERNYLALYPSDIDIGTNTTFANTILEELGAQVVTYTDRSRGIDWSNPRPLPQFVRQISVSGEHVRTAVQRLFSREEIGAVERSIMADPFRELDRCLDFSSRLSPNISNAQKEIIEAFVEPYVQILKDKMEPWQIERALDKACIVVKGYVDPERAFKLVMRTMFINREPFVRKSDTNPNVAVINKEWGKDTQEEVLDSLYMMGRILTGKANLESALIQSGNTLPNLQTQEQVVRRLFEPAQAESAVVSE